MSSEPAVEVVDLVKEYELGEIASLQHTVALVRWRLGGERPRSDTVRALDGVSLSIGQGESVAILGRNGSGKSTLVKLISDVTVPTAGLIRVRGRVMPLLSVGAGFRVELTGRENVMLLGSMLGLVRRDIAAAMEEIAEFAEIARAHLDTPVKRYSSGMRARLSFAASLGLPAQVYILDEVLSAADDGFKERAAQHLETLRDGGARSSSSPTSWRCSSGSVSAAYGSTRAACCARARSTRSRRSTTSTSSSSPRSRRAIADSGWRSRRCPHPDVGSCNGAALLVC